MRSYRPVTQWPGIAWEIGVLHGLQDAGPGYPLDTGPLHLISFVRTV